MKGRLCRQLPFFIYFRIENRNGDNLNNVTFVMHMMEKVLTLLLVLGLLVSGCSFTKKVKNGVQAYSVKQYSLAAQLFAEEYPSIQTPSSKAQIAFLAGETQLALQNPEGAIEWYDKAIANGHPDEALIRKAQALKRVERYDEAIAVYEDLQRKNPGSYAFRSSITALRQAKESKSNPNKNIVVSPVSWNTDAAEYLATPISRDEILFTSDQDSKGGENTYLWTGRAFSNLFVFNTISGSVSPYSDAINSDKNEGTGSISPDGKWLVFTRCMAEKSRDAYCKLYVAERKGNEWSDATPLSFQQENVNYGHPAWAGKGVTLFFSANPESGRRGHDLFFTQPDENGNWSEPVNLGELINSEGNEMFPTVYKDTLYYSTDNMGLGGLDIYKTYLSSTGNWAPPTHLGTPLNSGEDDFGFVVDTFSQWPDNTLLQGYFSSSRNSKERSDDIYRFTWSGKLPEIVIPPIEKTDDVAPVPVNQDLFIVFRVLEPVYEEPGDPNSRVVHKKPLPNGPIIISKKLTDERFTTDELGQLIFKLDWNTQYTFTARYRDHLTSVHEINTAEVERDPTQKVITLNHTFILDPIFKNKEIELENIFYDYDQWTIREDAKPSLNKLAVILKNNPQIRILLSSYTDCRGTDEYNLDLSQKRAKAAIDYLASIGIPNRRLESMGFGESALVEKCACETCTEEQHQENRRTTFKIID